MVLPAFGGLSKARATSATKEISRCETIFSRPLTMMVNCFECSFSDILVSLLLPERWGISQMSSMSADTAYRTGKKRGSTDTADHRPLGETSPPGVVARRPDSHRRPPLRVALRVRA